MVRPYTHKIFQKALSIVLGIILTTNLKLLKNINARNPQLKYFFMYLGFVPGLSQNYTTTSFVRLHQHKIT